MGNWNFDSRSLNSEYSDFLKKTSLNQKTLSVLEAVELS